MKLLREIKLQREVGMIISEEEWENICKQQLKDAYVKPSYWQEDQHMQKRLVLKRLQFAKEYVDWRNGNGTRLMTASLFFLGVGAADSLSDDPQTLKHWLSN